MLSFPKGGGRGALKEKQTNIDSPQSQLGLKWDEESPSLQSYPGRAATAEGSCSVFEQQQHKVLLLCWEDLWHQCQRALPFGPSACPARHSQHGARPALHTAASMLPPHMSANNQRAETRAAGGRTVSFEPRWWMAARSYLIPGDLHLAWPGGKKH